MTAPAAVRERPILFSAAMVRAILDGSKTQTRRVVKLPRSATFDNCAVQTWDTEADRLRAIAPEPPDIAPYLLGKRVEGQYLVCNLIDDVGIARVQCPYGQPGDLLWVRERHSIFDMRPESCDTEFSALPTQPCPVSIGYAADGANRDATIPVDEWRESFDTDHIIWRPSIHMPRWASRITLEITSIRVERLQSISEADALAEGVECQQCDGVNWREVGGEPQQCAHPHCGDGIALYRHMWNSLNASRGYGWDVNPWVWVIEFARVTA